MGNWQIHLDELLAWFAFRKNALRLSATHVHRVSAKRG
jgi:hypothetical protein